MQTTTPTIEDMNEAIAEFMELEKDINTWRRPYGATVYLIDGYWYPVRKLKFHSSWDALMPVVEKISKMPLLNVDNTPCTDYIDTCYPITFNMPTEDGRVMFRFKGFGLHEAEKLIDAVHAAVYEVARHENSQPPK